MNRVNTALHIFSIPLAIAVGLAVPGAALADEVTVEVEETDKLGIGFSAGGGITGFVDGGVTDIAENGATWEARVTFGTRSMLALEAAYIGTTQDFGLTMGNVGVLGSGAEAALRVNVGTYKVQPFLFGGVGWLHYNARLGDDIEIDTPADDDILTIPAGLGIGFRVGPALIDIRGTYRFAFDEELLREEGEFEAEDSFDSWAATARVGFEI